MGMVEDAKVFAEEVHKGQVRKGSGVPMFTHLERVAGILRDAGFSEEVVAAGFLHDTVEDTSVTSEDIFNLFGDEVAYIVAGHTEDKSKTWEERKQATIDELKDPMTPLSIRALIIADRLDNLRSYANDIEELGEDLWKRFKRGRKEQEWYFRGCLEYACTGLREEQVPSFFKEYEKEVNVFFN